MSYAHTELKPVNKIAIADRLLLSEDVRLFTVLSIEGETQDLDGRRKVHLCSQDGDRRIMLVRAGREVVRVVVDH